MTGDKLSTLEGYPCPLWPNMPKYRRAPYRCDPEAEWCGMTGGCQYEPIYRAHIKLLALRRAVLGDMTAERAGRVYRKAGRWHHRSSAIRHHFMALADVVEGLDA